MCNLSSINYAVRYLGDETFSITSNYPLGCNWIFPLSREYRIEIIEKIKILIT